MKIIASRLITLIFFANVALFLYSSTAYSETLNSDEEDIYAYFSVANGVGNVKEFNKRNSYAISANIGMINKYIGLELGVNAISGSSVVIGDSSSYSSASVVSFKLANILNLPIYHSRFSIYGKYGLGVDLNHNHAIKKVKNDYDSFNWETHTYEYGYQYKKRPNNNVTVGLYTALGFRYRVSDIAAIYVEGDAVTVPKKWKSNNSFGSNYAVIVGAEIKIS